MNRPSWDEYFMAIAAVVSSRASCINVRAGSVIVLDNRIIGTGYNGSPPGIKQNCLEAGCRKEKLGVKYGSAFNVGKCIGVHAEVNALANLTREIHRGATLYTTIFPCPACAKNLLAHNIKRVVYKKDYEPDEAMLASALFREAGVEVERLDIDEKRLNEIMFGMDAAKFGVFK